MMGGEFCVNATRAAALMLVRQGRLGLFSAEGETPVWGGVIAVSGARRPVRVLLSADAPGLYRTIAAFPECFAATGGQCRQQDAPGGGDAAPERLFCAALVDCSAPATVCRPMHRGVSLVSMPGMPHLLVDASRHPLPDLSSTAWMKESAAWRRLCGLSDAPASGVVWYEPVAEGYALYPAVAVRATNSEHMESACGSASLALALALRMTLPDQELQAVDVRQPGGETLRVLFYDAGDPSPESAGAPQNSDRQPKLAWISGPVSLAAEGVAYL
jgi:hypothetical protein